ncbi:MAG: diaminopropionate ammonia-lyase [Actinomycetota bacterium]
MTSPAWLLNPHAAAALDTEPTRAPLSYHRKLPGYEPSPLLDAPACAARLGLRRVWVKDESRRLGLPSFKILGASWGVYRALEQRFGELGPWRTAADLAARLEGHRPLGLAAATDGNHGRAVARMARLLGLEARIFVPAGTARARIDAIVGEGARCEVVDGTYDDAVARSAQEAGERCLVISDTSWPGYADVPRWVIEGYSTIFIEIDEQLARRDAPAPEVVLIQVGVGALAAAAARHLRGADADDAPFLIGVEPTTAACVKASIEAGKPVQVPGPYGSIMAGLNCGTPSIVAWPAVSAGFDAFVAIDDGWARAGMRMLASEGIEAGETGAAGVGALVALLSDGSDARPALHLDGSATALVLCTEGATDPEAYARIVSPRPV